MTCLPWLAEKLLNGFDYIVNSSCYSHTQKHLRKHPEDQKQKDRECWECGYACQKQK